MPKKRDYEVGFGRPPAASKFKRGRSGNPKGRPKGAKNISTLIAKELNDRVTITENGKPRRLAKGQVAIRQLVNKAAAGDPKALQAVWKHYQTDETAGTVAADPLTVFDTPEHELVMIDICRRIRSMEELPDSADTPNSPTPPTKKGQL